MKAFLQTIKEYLQYAGILLVSLLSALYLWICGRKH